MRKFLTFYENEKNRLKILLNIFFHLFRSWPQMDGFLVRNVYPTYMGIFGGPRQFCFLRRYMAKTWWGIPDVPRDREWGPYRCTGRQVRDSNNVQTPYDKGYTKVSFI